MTDPIHSRPLSDAGRENFDLIFRKTSPVREIEKQMSAIAGEPCGSPAHQCSNPRHMEYHDLSLRLSELRRTDPVHSLTPGTIREYRSACCGAPLDRPLADSVFLCGCCGGRTRATLTKIN